MRALKLECNDFWGDVLTCFNRSAENIVVKPIIIPKLELGNVKVQIFLLTLWKVPTIPRASRSSACGWRTSVMIQSVFSPKRRPSNGTKSQRQLHTLNSGIMAQTPLESEGGSG